MASKKQTDQAKPKSRKKKTPEAVPATPEDIEALSRGDAPQTIVSHLDELRSRLLTVLIAICITTMVPFFVFGDRILKALTWPFYKSGLQNQTLNVFDLTEGFMLQLKSALIVGALFVVPLIIHQIWSYIRPAIDKEKRRFFQIVLFFAVIFFYAGAGITFFFFMPFTIKVLAGFTPSNMTTFFNASTYLHFMVFFCAAMGGVFEMPLVIMILTKLGLITPQFLSEKRKYAIVGIWILSAIITPTTDILTQSIVAIPLMILYELSALISKIMVIRAKRKETARTDS